MRGWRVSWTVGTLGAVAVATAGLASTAGAAPTTLFSSTTPGPVASAATVPAGICFVTITAAGGEGGSVTGAVGGAGATVQARVAVTPGTTLSAFVGGGGNVEDGGAGAAGAPA